MKKLFTLIILSIHFLSHSQTSNFIHTNGKYIIGPCGDTLTLRGVNYAPYNWGYTLSDLKINQIALSGANTVRIAWYAASTQTIYSNYVALDSVLSKCIQAKLIPILEIHDFTCANNTASLTAGANWFTSSNVLPILNKYKHSLIVNIANEALHVMWASNPSTALNTYKTTYQNIITNLRSVSGFDFPLMIDAPDCGQNTGAFTTSTTATNLISFDPKHNLIFSAHAYWYGYASNDSLQMATKINSVLAQNIPFVLGEIANLQDDVSMCQYTLNYQPLLNYCKTQKVSWLSWVWDHDGCSARQITTNGNFNSLTSYGNTILNNINFGLNTNPSLKSKYLTTNLSCPIITSITNNETLNKFYIYPNPSNGEFYLNEKINKENLKVVNAIGQEINFDLINQNQIKLLSNKGVYFLQINTEKGNQLIKLINL
ncbi:MAG: cellulase family glycosylhydrolase [Bacteroidetes bacterium]|nr:cellulase family glycosylhydrolase [Bacteroidota bacterium]